MRRLACVIGLLAACGGGGGGAPDAGPDAAPPSSVRVGVFAPLTALDLLFVVDNSAAMDEEQDALTDAFFRILGRLDAFPGGRPDLHVGVVSSDLGAGPFGTTNCAGDGDGGALQATARGACTPPTDAYLIDVDDGAGGRTINYDSTLDNAFTCIAKLGSDGCGFEQHLASMKAALDGSEPGNAGFLRDDAGLVVVILADEDDCSATDTTLFDPAQDALGPFSSFRCFEHGVDCATGNDDPRAPGERQDCGARADSPYMPDTQAFVDFLRTLKADPTHVMVATIIGPPTPVEVGVNPEQPPSPRLVPSCQGAVTGIADPGVRLAAFARGFPARHVVTSICADDGYATGDQVGQLISHFGAGRCLVGDLTASAEALSASCTVADVTDLDGPTEQRTPVPGCETTAFTPPCWTITSVPTCTLNPAHAVVTVDRGNTPAPAGSVIVVDCPE